MGSAGDQPFSDTANPAFKASVMGFIDSVDTMILGANTYAEAKGYWPYPDEQGEFGEYAVVLKIFKKDRRYLRPRVRSGSLDPFLIFESGGGICDLRNTRERKYH